MKRKVLIALAVLFALVQFRTIDKTNPEAVDSEDFFSLLVAPEGVQNLIQTSCYDCHSHTTSYPWYSSVAPVSWWLAGHIEEGREHMNFSTFGQLSEAEQLAALQECAEVLEDKEMPSLPYMLIHNDAWVDEDERAELAQFFRSQIK